LKNRSKKLLLSAAGFTMPARSRIGQLAQEIKVFWFFSSEKNFFLSNLLFGRILMIKLFWAALILVCGAMPARAVGFATSSVPDPGNPPLLVGIWYPSDAPEKPVRISLDTAQVAPGGPVAAGMFKLIVMSHGQGGGFANQVDTAVALARAGFVVAAPTHTGDNLHDGSRLLKIWDRTRQLHVVTDWVLSTWAGHAHLDQSHIGVFGFSAGGFTALVAAGGVPDMSLIDKHCATYPTEFTCTLIAQANPAHAPLPKAPPGGFVHDKRIAAAVVVAPALGFTFGKSGLAGVRMPVQLWRAEQDTTLPQPFYAQAVDDDLPTKPDYRVVPHAQHLDFLSPCDAAKTRIAPQICSSLPGFSRAAFHAVFDRDVVRFFQANLK
jgi:predicted dienelactone hydrolase